MNKIIISGTSGHIGSIIKQRLKNMYTVISINRNKIYNDKNSITYNDILNIKNDTVLKKISSCDTFIHIASSMDFNNLNEEISHFNCYKTHSIFSLLKQIGLKKVILISGAPIVHANGHIINEKATILSNSVYHLSKFYQEKLLEILNFDYYFNLRISSPISPVINKKTIFKVFMDHAISNDDIIIKGLGSRLQNYIDVRDISTTIEDLIKTDDFLSGTYNICSDKSISNLNLARLITEVVPTKSKIKHVGNDTNDDVRWLYDISKAKENLSFKINYPLKRTILDYYKLQK